VKFLLLRSFIEDEPEKRRETRNTLTLSHTHIACYRTRIVHSTHCFE
jgi:hypothetical protein